MLDSFLGLTLGVYHPEILIVTTPNCEYNVNFPDLKYNTPESIFRHDDHKFEWTRKEFEFWYVFNLFIQKQYRLKIIENLGAKKAQKDIITKLSIMELDYCIKNITILRMVIVRKHVCLLDLQILSCQQQIVYMELLINC